MAADVRVHITDQGIITALNTPGKPVRNWSEVTRRMIVKRAKQLAPVNDPDNAMHRGGVVGTYKKSIAGDNVGTNGHRVRARIYATAPHAWYVEFGNWPGKPSGKVEAFTWVGAMRKDDAEFGELTPNPGGTVIVKGGAKGYRDHPNGHKVIQNAVNGVMPSRTQGRYTPLHTTAGATSSWYARNR